MYMYIHILLCIYIYILYISYIYIYVYIYIYICVCYLCYLLTVCSFDVFICITMLAYLFINTFVYSMFASQVQRLPGPQRCDLPAGWEGLRDAPGDRLMGLGCVWKPFPGTRASSNKSGAHILQCDYVVTPLCSFVGSKHCSKYGRLSATGYRFEVATGSTTFSCDPVDDCHNRPKQRTVRTFAFSSCHHRFHLQGGSGCFCLVSSLCKPPVSAGIRKMLKGQGLGEPNLPLDCQLEMLDSSKSTKLSRGKHLASSSNIFENDSHTMPLTSQLPSGTFRFVLFSGKGSAPHQSGKA